MKTRRVSRSIMLIALIACMSHTSVAQQPKERVIRRLPVEENEPIAITDIKVNDLSVSFDKKFAADVEWLRSLVFSVKNKSDKLILFTSIRLKFPRPAGSRDIPSIYAMSCGNRALRSRPPTAEERLVGIPPGETVEIRLSVQEFVDVRQFLSATNFPSSIEKVDVSIGQIILENDTMWYAGALAVRDPKEPSTWIYSQYINSKPQ